MRNLSISFLILFFGTVAMAQTNINSPYSSLGLGELSGLDHAVSSALGNTTITLQDSTLLNFYNPATYSALGQGQPLFSFGVGLVSFYLSIFYDIHGAMKILFLFILCLSY